MDQVSLIIGLANILTAIVVMVLSVPLLRQQVPRNRWYGFRFPSSQRSDQRWYAVNRYGAARMIGWSSLLLIAGIACLFVPLEAHPTRAITAGMVSLVLLVPAFQTWWYSRQLEV